MICQLGREDNSLFAGIFELASWALRVFFFEFYPQYQALLHEQVSKKRPVAAACSFSQRKEVMGI